MTQAQAHQPPKKVAKAAPVSNQAAEKEGKIVKLRVIAKRYVELTDNKGKSKVVVEDWATNLVIFNKNKYGPGAELEVPESQVEDLLSSGSVQLASEEPIIFRPPSIEHKISLSHGINLKEDVLGKVPTRTAQGDKNAPWVNPPDEGEEDQDDY